MERQIDPRLFSEYTFGNYWDWWAHIQQMDEHGGGIEVMGDRWQKRPIGGECACNRGQWSVQPGDDWNPTEQRYRHSALPVTVRQRFPLPSDLSVGGCVLALVILDPAGLRPLVRFATRNDLQGGRYPFGFVGGYCIPCETSLVVL